METHMSWEDRFDSLFAQVSFRTKPTIYGSVDMEDEVKSFISTERQRVLDEVRGAITKAINHGTLPDPNQYGNSVRLRRHNQVVKEMESILLSTLKKLEQQ